MLAKLPLLTKFIFLNPDVNVIGKLVRQRTYTTTMLTRIVMMAMLAQIVISRIL